MIREELWQELSKRCLEILLGDKTDPLLKNLTIAIQKIELRLVPKAKGALKIQRGRIVGIEV